MNDEYENLLPELVRSIIKTTSKALEVSIPCIVTKVISRTKVNVRPLVNVVEKDGTTRGRAVIEGVPVSTFGAGDTLISFPVKAGNIGWLDACDRDLSLFLQSYGETSPPTDRMHSFSDARFVPDIMTNITIDSEDDSAMVIQTRDGAVKIALDASEIRIKNNDTSITIDGSSVTGTAQGGFNLNGFTIDASGAASSPVSISAPSVLADSKELAGHNHPAGSPPGNTGENN